MLVFTLKKKQIDLKNRFLLNSTTPSSSSCNIVQNYVGFQCHLSDIHVINEKRQGFNSIT
jgi:hypothetical protein